MASSVSRNTPDFANIDLIDGNWARAALDFARRAGAASPVLDYGALASTLDNIRSHARMPASERKIALLAIDQDNVNQRKLVDAIEFKGVRVWRIDYRHAYVSVPLDDMETTAPNPQSMSHWMTYMCGLLAVRQDPTVVLVTGAFELAGPLVDFVETRGGTAIVAYFRRLLDKRWISNGLLDGGMPLKFVDLDEYSQDLLGADLRQLTRRNLNERPDGRLPI